MDRRLVACLTFMFIAAAGFGYADFITVRDAPGGVGSSPSAGRYFREGTYSRARGGFNGVNIHSVHIGAFNLEYAGSDGVFKPFQTFCVEPTEPIEFGDSTVDTAGVVYETRSLESSGFTAAESDMIRSLWKTRFESSLNDQVSAGAFQAAIWEMKLDDDLNLSTGNFRLDSNDPLSAQIKAAAENLLQGPVTRGSGPNDPNLLVLHSGPSQDFLFEVNRGANIPEPASALCVAVGLGALGLRRNRLRRG